MNPTRPRGGQKRNVPTQRRRWARRDKPVKTQKDIRAMRFCVQAADPIALPNEVFEI